MPNWCVNELSITGPDTELRRFKRTGKAKSTALSLDRFVPIPDELQGKASPAHVVPDDKYEQALQHHEAQIRETPLLTNMAPISESMSQAYSARFGADNWYDWCMENWGTKWDVQATLIMDEPGELRYTFASAWDPPLTWLATVSRIFPVLKFEIITYLEEESSRPYFARAKGGILGAPTAPQRVG